jgi:NADPH:quinone reductase
MMRAVGFWEFGGPEVLRVVELGEPLAGPGEVRVRVAAAAVNPTDLLFRSGRRTVDLSRVMPPYVPGMELAGWIDALGDGVASLRVGDAVIAVTSPPPTGPGAQAEFVVVPSASVAAAPRGLTLVQAATLGMNGLTALQALDLLALPPGATLGVTGAAGAVGGYAVQLGKAAGLRVIVHARERDRSDVLGLGADVFVSRADDMGGLDGLIDAALVGPAAMAAVRDGGAVATLRGGSAEPERDISIRPVAVSLYLRESRRLDKLSQLAEQGKLQLRVAAALPPDQAPEAHRRLEAGGVRGRLVIEFDERA